MQATEILTSLRSEKPNASSFKAPAIGQLLFVEEGSLTILTSLRSERPELLSKVQTKQGDRGVGGGGRADNPDQSAVREIRHRNRNRTRNKTTRRQKEGHKHEVREGGVRVALTERPGTTKGGFRVRQTTQRGTTGEQTRKRGKC
jgi:hypothetical protein